MTDRTATLREALNRLRWDAQPAGDEVVLSFRERAAGVERLAEVRFAAIASIAALGINLADGTFLPYHRVVTVRQGATVLWRRPEV